jgi:triosephosphate isomerase
MSSFESKIHPSVTKRTPIVGGNWKCNPSSIKDLPKLVANINACDTSKCEVYVCPSSIHLGILKDSFTNGTKIASQNCNFTGTGAYTGEMAVEQMMDMGIEWVLLGHSERRGEFGINHMESNQLLAKKLTYLLSKGLKCTFCIGEPLSVREQGKEAVVTYCSKQLEDIKHLLNPSKVVIAYEPVWSIGTGVTATPEQAQETHAGIRNWIAENVSQEVADNIRIQYGGSANSSNVPALSKCPDIDGFLVGGASMKPEFIDIVATLSVAKDVNDTLDVVENDQTTWPPSQEVIDKIGIKSLTFTDYGHKFTLLIYWNNPELWIFNPVHYARTQYVQKNYTCENSGRKVTVIIGKED